MMVMSPVDYALMPMFFALGMMLRDPFDAYVLPWIRERVH